MKYDFQRRDSSRESGLQLCCNNLCPPLSGCTKELVAPTEGANTPNICLGTRADASEALMRRIKQIGVDYVLTGGPTIPWTEEVVRKLINHFKAGGLTLCNMMIGGFPNTLYGKAGRDDEIEKVRQSIRAAGRPLPVIEYNFYAHRIVEAITKSSGARRGIQPSITTR